jgi:hypothetical protein
MLGSAAYGQAAPLADTGDTVNTPAAAGGQSTNMEENTKLAQKPGSIVWWMVMLAVYLGWDYFSNREKLREAIQPANIRTNWYNIIWATVAVVLGINFFNILLTKLAALRIPGISKAAGTLLPLFHL